MRCQRCRDRHVVSYVLWQLWKPPLEAPQGRGGRGSGTAFGVSGYPRGVKGTVRA